MDKNCFAYGIEISDSDWEKTPANVKELVEKMGQHIKQSEEKLAEQEVKQQELLEKINRTSKNSSSPPSLDPPNAEKRPEKNKSGKKRRTSFGSQTQAGITFVQRMLTDVTTPRYERRNVLDFITSAVSAARVGKVSPSLLPKVPVASKQVTNAA